MTEEVREALMRLSMCARGDCSICKYAGDTGCSVEEQIAMVTDNAFIIAEALDRLGEEKHGRWQKYRYPFENGMQYIMYQCSECGARFQEVGYGWPYCPECGARMDGGSHEDD